MLLARSISTLVFILLLLLSAGLMLACDSTPPTVATATPQTATPQVATATPQVATATPPVATATPASSSSAANTPTFEPTRTASPTATPTPVPTPTPEVPLIRVGTHIVGEDIEPGIYFGEAEGGARDTCYWQRLSGLSGETSDIIANDNAVGRFYIEVLPTDAALDTDCELAALEHAPAVSGLLTDLDPGAYLVGRDIQSGLYSGEAGTGALNTCYWERLSGVSGDSTAIIANDNASGRYFVQVSPSDFAVTFRCAVTLSTSTSIPATTSVATATPTPVPTRTPLSPVATPPVPIVAPTLVPSTPAPTFTPTPVPTPIPEVPLIRVGTHIIGEDIEPGIYFGEAESGVLGSCYWQRLSGLRGETSAIIANDIAVGRFYIEVLPTDAALDTDCELVPLQHAPAISGFLTDLDPGAYLVGRDIQSGLYSGEAGTGAPDTCYWKRLSGLSGETSAIIANDNASGRYFVQVSPSDFAVTFGCAVTFER